MEFCQRCGTRLIRTHDNGTCVLVCHKCGVKTVSNETLHSGTHRQSPNEKIFIVNPVESELSGQPTVHVNCPQCSNRRAYSAFIEIDEEEVSLFRCTRCHYVWREGT